MKIFISHISEEGKIANTLKEWIESTFSGHCSVFVSSNTDDIPPGSKWLDQIDDALSETAILLIICSPSSISRPWINFEAGCGWIKKIPVMPLCHSELRKSGLPQPLAMLQGLDIETESFTDDLIKAIAKYLKIKKIPRISHEEFKTELKYSIESLSKSQAHRVQTSQIEHSTIKPYDENDIIAILKSWMGARPDQLNRRVIHFLEIDRELTFEPGTSKKYIKQVAKEWNYIVDHEGETTILFKKAPRQQSVGVVRGRSTWLDR